ncbi:MAG: hypothetical protein RL660_3062 [Bacteroidota bacterium]|jgi:uncharacterized membrane-anchored protein
MNGRLRIILIALGILFPLLLIVDHFILSSELIVKTKKHNETYISNTRGGKVVIKCITTTDNCSFRVLEEAYNQITEGQEFAIHSSPLFHVNKKYVWTIALNEFAENAPGFKNSNTYLLCFILIIAFWILNACRFITMSKSVLIPILFNQYVFLCFYLFMVN